MRMANTSCFSASVESVPKVGICLKSGANEYMEPQIVIFIRKIRTYAD